MHVAEVEPRGELQFCKSVASAQIESTAEILDSGWNMSELIMSLAPIDQDLAAIRRLSIVDQLNCSIELPNRVAEQPVSKQQQAVLRSRNDSKLAQRLAGCELLGFDE